MEPVILIVEDSLMYGRLLERSIINSLGFKTIWLKTFADTEAFLKTGEPVTMALLDYCLPDALDGEIIDLCLDHDVPSVIITSSFSDDLQETIWSKRVLDYIVKEGAHAIQYILDLIERVVKNAKTGILIVDDSRMSRTHIRQILEPFHFTLYEAADGLEALEVLEKNDDIKLVLTDYHMPKCDGFELTRRIRQTYLMDKLAIIGLSSHGSHQLTIKFIKYGANDFMTKPFIREMLYCRINQNLKIVEHFDTLRQVSLIDHMTNINNRRYLFEAGDIVFEDSIRTGKYPIVAMIDIDYFKELNDTYGHDMGDRIICKVAETLSMDIRKSDIISRYGGDEFCIICRNMDREIAPQKFDMWRKQIEELPFECDGQAFNVTITIGLCLEEKGSFLQMIKAADEKLYQAKKEGRNRVCW